MTDTLQIDTLQVAQWRSDVRFDYDRELARGGENLWGWLMRNITRYFHETMNTILGHESTQWILIAVGVLFVGFVCWLLWKYKPGLFGRSGKMKVLDYEVAEDTIYGIDFEAELRKAVNAGSYREAVRLVYLQTLAALSDAHRLEWQPQKTPTQYVREVGRPDFAQLSRHFVRVRYGNFEATQGLLEEMLRLQRSVEEGGGHE